MLETSYTIDKFTILNVVNAEPMDALSLSDRLREHDLLEVQSMGKTPLQSLMSAFELIDSEVYSIIEIKFKEEKGNVVFKESKVIAMFGVNQCPHLSNYGVAWMLSSCDLEKYSKPFLRYCRKWIQKIQQKYEVLYNLVHCQNAQGIRWLQWCGFDIKTSKTYGVNGEDFYLFIREKKQCVTQ